MTAVAARRIKAILNPSARSGRARAALSDWAVAPDGTRVEWAVSESPAHLRRLVREAALEGADALLLAGGDGTVALAVQALEGAPAIPLGILPVGSGNDFARELGISRSTSPWELLARGARRPVDVGRLEPGGVRFCCVASVGFDARALELIHGSSLPRSKLLNTTSALRALWSTPAAPVRVTWDGGRFEGPAMLVAATVTRGYGGGFLLSPGARVDDGLLDLCIIGDIGRARLVLEFRHIFAGTHGGRPGVTLAQSKSVKIESLAGPLPVCLDGELARHEAPVELVCEPAAVEVLTL